MCLIDKNHKYEETYTSWWEVIKTLVTQREFSLKSKKQKVVEINHTVINFQPLIRKLKIDLFLDRKIKSDSNTSYLKAYKGTF